MSNSVATALLIAVVIVAHTMPASADTTPVCAFKLNHMAQCLRPNASGETVHPSGPPVAIEDDDSPLPQRRKNPAFDFVDVGGDMQGLETRRVEIVDPDRSRFMMYAVDMPTERSRFVSGESDQLAFGPAVTERLDKASRQLGLARAIRAFKHQETSTATSRRLRMLC